jgi:YHS domain-containing protein
MIRFLIYGLGAYVAYRMFKARPASLSDADNGQAAGGELAAGEDLIKDPQCGTYFLKQRGIETTIDGELVYFCSRECRDGYLVDHHPR